MNKTMMVFLSLFFLSLMSCSHMEQVDRSFVFQESMGFDGVLEPSRAYPLSNLGPDAASQSQGCAVCSK